MMVMAFQSSPIFSLPRARLECSVFRFMRPLGVLRASYYHGGVRREATEASRGREFRSHSRKSASNANSLCRHVLAEPTEIITISQIHHSRTDSRVRVLNARPRSGSPCTRFLFGTCHHISQGGAAPEGRPAAFMPAPVTRTTFLE